VASYLVRRTAQAVVVVVLVSVVVFVLIHLLPDFPRGAFGPRATPAQVDHQIRVWGFDKPWWQQYLSYAGQLLHGNLGFSYLHNLPVATVLADALPRSAFLVGVSTAVALVVAVPLGIFQAVRRNRVEDYVLTGTTFVFYSMPSFWLGILLIAFFADYLHLLPAEGPQSGVWSPPSAMVLPIATLALVSIAQFSRYMRSSALDSLTQDYIRTARAKGLPPRSVLLRHVLRNSLIPIATLVGLSLPVIFGGALVTESVFNYPGVGWTFFNSAVQQDFPTLMGIALVGGVATVAGSLLADVLYALLDPRVRY
jgi:peptide/nickel transport system permease protein